MSDGDTIAAISTPAGRGGIGIVRVSGPAAGSVARCVLGRLPPPRYAEYALFMDADGQSLDSGLALYFPAPNSFTGENVLELHGHGGPVVLQLLLERCMDCGARAAGPGEFTQRAFQNGKLDLAQAEAVADLIDSCSEQAARSAQRSLQGEFSTRTRALIERLIELRCHVEAAIDFPEEEIDFLSDARVTRELEGIIAAVQDLLSSAEQGCLLREGLNLVLVGRPNAGKSSLLNALARTDRAIVNETPGTTRDTIEVRIQLDGMPVSVVDTAGLRTTQEPVENEGVRRTYAALQNADHAFFIVDDCVPLVAGDTTPLPADVALTYVFNKIDLSKRPAGAFAFEHGEALAISAKTGQGLAELRQHLKQVAGYRETEGSTFIARSRHLTAIRLALDHIDRGRRHLAETRAGELLAEELRLAQQDLSEITGEFTSDQLLGRIFSNFCIGK